MAAKSSTCELNYCRYLPFFNLFYAEFNTVIGNWHYDLDIDLDLFNILPNPDKFDDNIAITERILSTTTTTTTTTTFI